MLHAAITATVLVTVITLAEPWDSEARPLAQAKRTPSDTPTPSVTPSRA